MLILDFSKSDGGLNAQWKKTMNDLNATFREKKNTTAFEGMIITSDSEFFEKLGYVPGMSPPIEVMDFFDSAYRFALTYIGYHGTDENILSAVIHFDETTPHLQLYYRRNGYNVAVSANELEQAKKKYQTDSEKYAK